MKIRKGYVSNSSSSSFIINPDKDKTVLDYAIQFVAARDWIQYDSATIKNLLSLKNRSDWDNDSPIIFPSCNYDTYLIKVGKHIYVNTCNNHGFNLLLNNNEIVTYDIEAILDVELFENLFQMPIKDIINLWNTYDNVFEKYIPDYFTEVKYDIIIYASTYCKPDNEIIDNIKTYTIKLSQAEYDSLPNNIQDLLKEYK